MAGTSLKKSQITFARSIWREPLYRQSTMMAAAAILAPTTNAPPTPTLPVAISPHVAEKRHHRRRRSRPFDQNRTLQILTILLIYIIIVHYALKYATFLIPHDSRSREERLGMREGRESLESSGRLGGTVRGVLGFSHVMSSSSSLMVSVRRKARIISRTVGVYCPVIGQMQHNYATIHSIKSKHPMHEMEITDIDINDDIGLTTNEVGNGRVNVVNQKEPAQNNTTTIQERPRIPILSYQNSYVIVSKPAGMTVHTNSNSHARWGQSKKSPVLQSILKKQLCRKVYLVHRLDHRTSGACILGFTSDMAGRLHGRLRDDNAIKLYVALVRGDLRSIFQRAATSTDDGNNRVDMSVNSDGSVIGSRDSIPTIMSTEKYAVHRGEEHFGKLTVNLPIAVDGVAKDAITDVYFLASMPNNVVADDNSSCSTSTITSKVVPASSNGPNSKTPYITKSLTLLLCRPKTGRTHQIRKHLQKALNAPIIGDVQHGDSRVNRFWRECIGLDRLGLHCSYLELPPLEVSCDCVPTRDDDKQIIQCIAPLTHDFIDALRHERLKSLWNEAICVEPVLSMESYDERGGTYGRHYRKRQ